MLEAAVVTSPRWQREDLIGDLLTIGAQRAPARPLFAVDGGASRTYAEVDVRANRIGNALLGCGLRHGDRVAVWSDDCVEYLETYMGTARAGLVMVPINNRLTPEEARFIAHDSDARCLMLSDRLAPLAAEAFGRSDFGLVVAYGSERPLGAKAFEDLLRDTSETEPPRPSEDDLFVIAYTSGTTGFPKGAMLTHRSVKNIARMNTVSYHLPLASVAAYTGSMSFTSTVCAFGMSHLFVGGSVVLLGKWDPQRAVDMVVRNRTNFVYVPTPGIADFCAALEQQPAALACLSTVFHSASKASPEMLRLLVQTAGPRFVEGWGMTEISGGIVTATTERDVIGDCEALDFFRSVGRATVDSAIEVVDENRVPIAHDGVSEGELAVRSTALMKGYWNRPEATDRAIANGWYYTGDLGSIDPAGYIYVSERRSDLIVSGGMNVYPSEIEAVIGKLSGVADVAIVGVPHARYGQTVAAAIVIRPGMSLSAEDVIAHCRQHLASYKKPTVIRFTDELPKTVSQKLKRGAVRSSIFADLADLPDLPGGCRIRPGAMTTYSDVVCQAPARYRGGKSAALARQAVRASNMLCSMRGHPIGQPSP
jgi:fatty-acyl-CoA synthase